MVIGRSRHSGKSFHRDADDIAEESCARQAEQQKETLRAEDMELKAKYDKLVAELKDYEEAGRVPASQLLADNASMAAKLDKHRWIPVSEKLPEKNAEYLVTDGKDGWMEWWSFVDSSGARGWEHNCNGEISHYKPILLPEGE